MITEQTTLKRWGAGGLCLSINATMRKLMQLQEGTPVEVEVDGDTIIVKKIENKKRKAFPYSEKELIAGLEAIESNSDLLVNPSASEWTE